jgi:hypothetical protein
VGRRDRERARKRHAIERARRAATGPEGPRPARPAPRARRPSRPAGPARGRRPLLTKGQVGDLDPRGRVRKRPMLVHPRLTVRVIFIGFLVALPGAVMPLFGRTEPNLQPVTFAAFGVCFLGLADLARTWLGAGLQLAFAALSFAVALATLLVG